MDEAPGDGLGWDGTRWGGMGCSIPGWEGEPKASPVGHGMELGHGMGHRHPWVPHREVMEGGTQSTQGCSGKVMENGRLWEAQGAPEHPGVLGGSDAGQGAGGGTGGTQGCSGGTQGPGAGQSLAAPGLDSVPEMGRGAKAPAIPIFGTIAPPSGLAQERSEAAAPHPWDHPRASHPPGAIHGGARARRGSPTSPFPPPKKKRTNQ